jgi:hypothetical protein
MAWGERSSSVAAMNQRDLHSLQVVRLNQIGERLIHLAYICGLCLTVNPEWEFSLLLPLILDP